MPIEPGKGAPSVKSPLTFGHHAPSLNDRLDTIAAELRARDPDGAEVVDRFIARLKAACIGHDAPATGEALPFFIMPDQDGRLTSLDALLRQGPLIVVFHRGHWCPYCHATLSTLAELHNRLLPTRIVAVSAETQRFTGRIRAETGAQFPFLSDVDAAYAETIGLAVNIEPPLRDLLEKSGKRIPDFQGGRRWVLPVPAVFLLDRDGVVQARHVDPNYRRRMDVDVLLEAVAKLAG